MKKAASILIVAVVGMAVMFGGRWYMYVTNTGSPYDELGIELNSYMPEPLRAWGCGKLHANFQRALPPHGCASPSGREWLQ